MNTRPHPRCYQGVIPAIISTASKEGVPNVTYLSQVFDVDERHVALSCQFFNKTKRNVTENPRATVILYDPVTFEAYRLELLFARIEESGPLFDGMAARIQAIASHTGMAGVFKLRSADVYEVVDSRKIEGFIDVPARPHLDDPGGRNELRALQVISQRAARAVTLDDLLEQVLESLETTLGFSHCMFLLADGERETLAVRACRGYPDAIIGTEIGIGEGLIGTVAAERRVLRVCSVEGELRYGRAVRLQLANTAARRGLGHEIPLLGLPDAQSQLAMPLVAGERCLGVLVTESRQRLGFDDWDETFLEIVANQVATRLGHLQTSQRAATRPPPPTQVRCFRFFPQDDCVFLDDAYLIRNVPGRILWKLLTEHVQSGRTEFTNRELRLDPWLGLPPVRDNLESRLALLRKRLEKKCPELSLPSTARGQFKLVVDCAVELHDAQA